MHAPRACHLDQTLPYITPLISTSPLNSSNQLRHIIMTAKSSTVVFLILLVFMAAAAASVERGERKFLLEKSEQVIKTDGGEFRVVRGRHMHIGFISMEPDTLLVPQYLDADLVLFVRRGDAKLGWIHDDAMAENTLRIGDLNRVPAGSAFYIVNTGKGQRLHIVCSIIPSSSSDYNRWDPSQPPFQSFYLGGGFHPKSILAGFDIGVLTAAFNSTIEEVRAITQGRTAGAIIHLNNTASEPSHCLLDHYNSVVVPSKVSKYFEEESSWATRKFFSYILSYGRAVDNKKSDRAVRAPDSYNLYDRKPDFRNRYGWTLALDHRDYHPLKHSDVGVFLVNLTASSMLAPHFNPRAAEYTIVLGGSGMIQVVYPNGTLAMNVEVAEGDVFWIPRYFPFCQIASRGGPLELFGYSTSASYNNPQFLASVLREMMGEELAAAMGVERKVLERFVNSQNESTVVPAWQRPEEEEEEEEEKRGKREESLVWF